MSEFEKELSKKAVPAANAVNEFEEGLYNKSEAQIKAELAALELESAELDIEIKREQVAKIKAARQAKLDENKAKVTATVLFLANRRAAQENCNHKKGGMGAESVMHGQGTDQMYAIVKHKLPHGKYMVLCLRCNKEFHPPVPILGLAGTPGWAEAVNWPTDNSPSGSGTFTFERTGAAA